MKIYASPQETLKEKLCIENHDDSLNIGAVKTITIGPKDFYVTFAYDETPSRSPDWYYCAADPNDFTWTSSDESIIKIQKIYGSSEKHYDENPTGGVSIRYSNGYDSGNWNAIYNRAEIVAVGTGKATITVKYKGYEIGSVTFYCFP